MSILSFQVNIIKLVVVLPTQPSLLCMFFPSSIFINIFVDYMSFEGLEASPFTKGVARCSLLTPLCKSMVFALVLLYYDCFGGGLRGLFRVLSFFRNERCETYYWIGNIQFKSYFWIRNNILDFILHNRMMIFRVPIPE